jgi:cytochrome b subunit of formate dehydrogenase
LELATFKQDVWGREVILGASWDLLWVLLAVTFVGIAIHAIIAAAQKKKAMPSAAGERIERHERIDRIFHWVMAASMFVLLITGIFPKIGIEFAWLTIHWVAGILLTVITVFHIIRSIFWQNFMDMWIGVQDLKEPFDQSIKPGKYSLAQKSMHASVTVLTLVIIVTGIIMFALIDTPWWERTNALPENLLGWVFLLHGLAALALVAITSLHIYFGLRPEKLFYTRSMIKGWISEYEKDENHDQEKWVTKN